MKKREKKTNDSIRNNIYLLKVAYSCSKSRVINSLIRQIISHLLWVFYSAFFVRFVINVIKQEYPMKTILVSIGIVGGLSLIAQIYLYYCDYILFPKEDVKIYQGIYERIYKKSENVEVGCYENSSFYNKFSIALDGAGNNISEGVNNISRIVGGIICAVVACWTMFQIDKFTGIFLIAPLLGNFVIAPRLNRIANRRYKDAIPYNRVMGYTNRVMYLSEYAKELRLSNMYNVLSYNYDNAAEGKSSLWKKYFKGSFLLGMLQYIFSYMVIFEGIILYGAYHALVGNTISFDEMAVLTSVMITASWVLVGVIRSINNSIEKGLLISNMREFLEYEETIPEDYPGIDPGNEVASIEFKKVSFSYNDDKLVIDNLSFKIEAGVKVAFVGHNGAGKSTIINLLLRLYDPTEGEILVNGVDIREYNLQKYRRMFTCAFQDYKIMPGTIRYNVLMGREADDQIVIDALIEAGVYDKVCSLKDGLDTVLTKEFVQSGELLSGGEYQKLIVARTFANTNASVAIFDEPSSSLDPISENDLFDKILKSTRNRIGIFISHRLSCVKDADTILMLENGRLIDDGPHAHMMFNKGLYYEMYKTQEKNYYAINDTEGEFV